MGERTDEAGSIPLADVAAVAGAPPEPGLSYGVSVPLWRRRRLRRVLFALVLAGGIGWLLWHRYSLLVVSRATFVREQQVQLEHEEPPDAIAYSQSESATFESLGRGNVRQWSDDTSRWDRFIEANVDHTSELVDDSDLPPGGGAKPAGRQYNTLVFLHERTSPGGARRLVEVGVSTTRAPKAVYITARVRLFEPGSVTNPRLKVVPIANRRETDGGLIPAWPGAVFGLYNVPLGKSTKLYTGHPHPDDASRFLIPYAIDGDTGVITGRLLDGDRVVLEGRPTANQTGTAPAATAPTPGR
jgi:hypothetical protein